MSCNIRNFLQPKYLDIKYNHNVKLHILQCHLDKTCFLQHQSINSGNISTHNIMSERSSNLSSNCVKTEKQNAEISNKRVAPHASNILYFILYCERIYCIGIRKSKVRAENMKEGSPWIAHAEAEPEGLALLHTRNEEKRKQKTHVEDLTRNHPSFESEINKTILHHSAIGQNHTKLQTK